MTSLLFRVKQLKKYFPVTSGLFRKQVGWIKAVDEVDFSIAQGEIVGLVGESGSGKSTVARAALRLIEPTAGEIFFEDQPVHAFTHQQLKEWRKQVQMVFQDPYSSLNPRKTITDSIGEALLYHNVVKNRSERDERVADILMQVGLDPSTMNRYPHSFSRGQQQRICIGRAIALKPQLIICDEAISALDVSVQAQILNLLLKLRQELNLSYLFIAHDLATVRHFCDYVIVLYLGHVMESGPVEDIFNAPKHPYTQALLSAIPCDHPREKHTFLPLSGEIPSTSHPPSGCPFRTRCPFAQPICAESVPLKFRTKNHSYRCILD